MTYRKALLTTALTALVAGLLVTSPAEAASYSAFLKSKAITISTAGNGKVAISCHSSSTCKGTLKFSGSTKSTSYSVKGKHTEYEAVAVNQSSPANPNTNGTSVNGQFKHVAATLNVKETSPRKKSHSYSVYTETRLASQQITGTATGPGSVTARRVELLTVDRGGNTKVKKFDNDLSDGYSFSIPLGTNNSPSATYRLRISAKDQDGISRSWFWRGSDDATTGGGRYLREASPIHATKYSNFDADFRYTSITGSAPSGTQVRIAGQPRSYSGGTIARRELDLVGCANIFGETTASGGSYRVDFLPYDPSTADKRYMVAAKKGDDESWNNSFGSCFDVQDYTYSRANELALSGSTLTYNVNPRPSGNNLEVNGTFSGFSGTGEGDRWLRLREKVPGVPILDAPVVAQRHADSNANGTFFSVPPGDYWLELGRRTGCSDWYKSVFPNNDAYFNGLDRGFETWKSFTTLTSLPGGKKSGYEYFARSADPNPATDAEQGHVPAGYKGWMYRSHCKAVGAGVYKTVTINGLDNGTKTVNSLTDRKGAVVRGHVSRTGGRTNKEMLVRLSSTDGKRVIRTDITDSKGNFYVAGLPSGTWTISVNSDSWRGIARTFIGKHSVSVTAGGTKSVGTLRLRG